MGQFEDLDAFATIVTAGSLTKAADEMGIAKSALSRRLRILEARFGATLIKRGHGEWQLTPIGQSLFERAEGLRGEFDEIYREFSEHSNTLAGQLRLALPLEFGLAHLGSFLLEFAAQNPAIELICDFDDHLVDLERDNYDLAVRVSSLRIDREGAEWIGSSQLSFVAARSYLAQFGLPRDFFDLQNHRLLHYGNVTRAVLDNPCDQNQSFTFKPALLSNSGIFLADAAMRGYGIALLPDFVYQAYVDQDKLVELFDRDERSRLEIYLLANPTRRRNNRMREFADALTKFLQ